MNSMLGRRQLAGLIFVSHPVNMRELRPLGKYPGRADVEDPGSKLPNEGQSSHEARDQIVAGPGGQEFASGFLET